MNDVTIPSGLVQCADPPSRSGGLPLKGVKADGRLDGLMFQLTVEQRYRNESDRVLEAVFTFPVPVRAVLLGLELELGERKLEAVAVGRANATERYEEAIDQGDAAVLLESNGNGLYTVSVGNLKPGESAVIRYRHAELLDANRGLLRLQVPTVIAPRYGHPRSAGLEGPAIPETNLVAEYPFDIEILLAGIQDDSALESPTHSIRTHRREDGTVVKLAKAAALDRDFVLEVPQAKVPKEVLIARDGDEWVAIASAVLPGRVASERRALALTVLLDCSGSMQGDSIEAAKRAVGRVLENLDGEDRIGLLRFGSRPVWETEGVVAASRSNLAVLRQTLGSTDADLGGTEMGQAIAAALDRASPPGSQADLLMITDGQVHDLDALADRVGKAKRRLFVVAVGSAPNEALARRLSEATGGACEFVASGELAEDAILRMFRRMRSAPRHVKGVRWPDPVAWQLPVPTAVFPDETVHVIAALKELPAGRARILVGGPADQGEPTAIEMPIMLGELEGSAAAAVVRVAGARRVKILAEQGEPEAAEKLAERLQIASAFTSFVVVAERSAEEKAKGLPATVPVGQMLPARFGGAVSIGEPMMSVSRSSRKAPSLRSAGSVSVVYCRSFDFPSSSSPADMDAEPNHGFDEPMSAPPSQDNATTRAIRHLRELWLAQEFVTVDQIREAAARESLSAPEIREVIDDFCGICGPILSEVPASTSLDSEELEELAIDDPDAILRLVTQVSRTESRATERAPGQEFDRFLLTVITAARGGAPRPETWEALCRFGVPPRVLQELQNIAREAGAREADTVTSFIAVALGSESVSSSVAAEIGKIWRLSGSLWTRRAQRKLRTIIRDRVFESWHLSQT